MDPTIIFLGALLIGIGSRYSKNQDSPSGTTTFIAPFSVLSIQVITLTFLISLMFGANLFASWNIIDDHEIFEFIGIKSSLPWHELFSVLGKTEIAQFGEAPRYRPAYYILRAIECGLWGKNPAAWYFIRITLIFAFALLFWKSVERHLGLALSGFATLHLLSIPVWSHLISRLGPAETYALLGMMFYFWGLRSLLLSNNQEYTPQSIVSFTLGVLVLVGVKENFIIFCVPSLLLIYFHNSGFKNAHLLKSMLIAHVLYGATIASSVLIALNKLKVDVYQRDVSLDSLLSTVVPTIFNYYSLLIVLLGALSLLVVRFVYKILPAQAINIGVLNSFIIFLCTIFLINQFFYAGRLPTFSRYDFPAVLIVPLLEIVILAAVLKILRITNTPLVMVRALHTILCGSLLVGAFLNAQNYGHAQFAIDNVERSRRFSDRLSFINDYLIQNPLEEVILVTNDTAQDYEALIAIDRFIRNSKGKVKISIEIDNSHLANAPKTALASTLHSRLVELSKTGNDVFLPLKDRYSECVAIVLGGSTEHDCKIILLENDADLWK